MSILNEAQLGVLLDEARAIAESRGGRLVTEHLETASEKVRWECARGHRWDALIGSVKKGTWCWRCSKHIPTIEDMRHLAAERGGKCLSTVYVDKATPLEWMCAQNHVWQTIPHVIVHGSWCPHCAKTRKLELKNLQAIARARNGRLLSRYYVDAKTPLWWTCAAKHIWRAKAGHVRGTQYHTGSWCRVCAYRARRKRPSHFVTIGEMKGIAVQRGGECISDIYVNSKTKLRFRCAKGHEWMGNPAAVKSGSWCPRCGHQLTEIDEVLAVAMERGVKLVSPASEYTSGSSVLLWECTQGHRWKASGTQVKRWRGCSQCLPNRPGSIEEMREIARARGGECLSKRYVNSTTPLRWRCADGHVWMAAPDRLKAHGHAKQGAWCAACYHASTKAGIDRMQEIACARGGQCLSKKYVDGMTPLIWRCSAGHVWKTTPKIVVKGAWCPQCAKIGRRLTIRQVCEYARRHGGECLSKEYVNNDTPMKWGCPRGHVWTQPFNFVKIRLSRPRGCWCTRCGRR